MAYALVIHSFILLECIDFCCRYLYIRMEGMLDTFIFFSLWYLTLTLKVLGMKPKEKTKLKCNIIPVRKTKLSSSEMSFKELLWPYGKIGITPSAQK